mgnify:CR=1 FL=1
MEASVAGHAIAEIAEGLFRFDTGYVRPSHTACYLVVEDGRAAIIDTGVPAAVPALLDTLDAVGIPRHAVERVIPTHVHLDHAGGAAALMAALPQARLGVHPSGVQHMADPAQLEAGVRALYGDAYFEAEYAPLRPIDRERIDSLEDGAVVQVGTRKLEIVHTPGHAWHHFSVLDRRADTLIAGDAFGAGYPGFGASGAPFMVPVVPPPQFKPEAYSKTLARIVALAPGQIAPAHFPLIDDVAGTAHRLEAMLDAGIEAARAAESVTDLEARLLAVWADWLPTGIDPDAYRNAYGLDIWLTAEGMWMWRQKQERKRGEVAYHG